MVEVWLKIECDEGEVGPAEVAAVACGYIMEGAARDYAKGGAHEVAADDSPERVAAEVWSTAWLREWDPEEVRTEGGRGDTPLPDNCINVFDSRRGQVARHYYLEEVHKWTA